nr:MAG TPA_asm: oxidoreductase [Caudoviricetes sp.]
MNGRLDGQLRCFVYRMIIIIIWVLPAILSATRRRARGKRLVFMIQGHHHHVCN